MMNRNRPLLNIHVLTPEYPPAAGGVSDYTRVIARTLASRGARVSVWCPGPFAMWDDAGVSVHARPALFSLQQLRAIANEIDATASPSVVLVQYVPTALGYRGLNLFFPLWLRNRRKRDAAIHVMFHEPYFYFGWHRPWRNALALIQRIMAAIALDAASLAWVSTPAWIPRLQRTRVGQKHLDLRWLPVPSTIPVVSVLPQRCDDKVVVGHFGTYGNHSSRVLRPVLAELLKRAANIHVRLIGRDSDRFIAESADLQPYADRLTGTGRISEEDVSLEVQRCDVMLQPYLDGVTTRRTTMMVALAHGRPTVTNVGPLTERLWCDSGAVALAEANSTSALVSAAIDLLGDDRRRKSMGSAALDFYSSTFSVDCAINTFLASIEAVFAGSKAD